jgi:GAF domain-containing protein
MLAQQTRVVFDILEQLSSARTTQGVLDILKEAVHTVAGADGATVMLRHGDFVHCADEATPGPIWEGQRLPLHSCIGGWVILNRQCAFIEDVSNDPRVRVAAWAGTMAKSLAVFPIRSADPVGALGVYWKDRLVPDSDLAGILQALANAAAIALDNVRLFTKGGGGLPFGQAGGPEVLQSRRYRERRGVGGEPVDVRF